MVEIREAEPADAAALAAMYRDAYAEAAELGFPMKAGAATADEVAGWIRDDTVLLAERDGKTVGAARLSAGEGEAAKLSRLGVRRAAAGEGIGTRLLDRAEARPAASNDAVRLTTPPDHPYLPDLYRDRGYEVVGEYPLDGREYDEVVMEKRV